MIDTRKVTAIINSVRAERGRGLYFNDKMKNGARSIKVEGWDSESYDIAVEQLELAGFTVKRVRTTGDSWFLPPQTRLHVS